MPLTPSGPLPSRGLHAQPARRSLHRGDATGAALVSTAGTKVRRLRAGLRDKPGRALSPPVLGSRCGVNCPEGQFNITGCCHEAPQSFAGALLVRGRFAPFGFTATPVMSCAPTRLPRGQLGTAPRAQRQKHVRSRLRRHRKDHSQARCARRVRRAPPPARPVSRGGVVPLPRHSFSRRVCPASRPPPPGGGSLNSRTAKRGFPCGASRQSRHAPQGPAYSSPSASRPEPPSRRGQSRGLDPFTTCAARPPRRPTSARRSVLTAAAGEVPVGTSHNAACSHPERARQWCGHQENGVNDWLHCAVRQRYVKCLPALPPQRLCRCGLTAAKKKTSRPLARVRWRRVKTRLGKNSDVEGVGAPCDARKLLMRLKKSLPVRRSCVGAS
jgi:hypothetical protein